MIADPAGLEAGSIAWLYAWMLGGGTVIWLLVVGLALYCARAEPGSVPVGRARSWIVGGGTFLSTVVLAVLLVFGLAMLPGLVAPAPSGSLTIVVEGELWWWRVGYLTNGTDASAVTSVTLANEIHLPVGKPVQFRLESDNVIHSFWIPELGGKMDMIPGRATRLAITPTRTGEFWGICAEFCGTSHALMRFPVVVEEPAAFDRWLASQARPAEPPASPLAVRGRELFLASGCGGCHTVRGTSAGGSIGPDLTHVGSRSSLAAGTMPRNSANLKSWISHPGSSKPEAHMPGFAMLPPEERQAIAAYLEGLR